MDSNDEDFEGVSITFNLDESADRFDNFSQEDFRTEVSKALKIPEVIPFFFKLYFLRKEWSFLESHAKMTTKS